MYWEWVNTTQPTDWWMDRQLCFLLFSSLLQLTIMLKEWDIPYDSLKADKESAKRGRFATVYKGNWHGDVAIKEFHLPLPSEPVPRVLDPESKRYLDEFKREVAELKKTRHNNLILFMGVCLEPPRLAIVTSYCHRGLNLCKEIHENRHRFSPINCALIGKQICEVSAFSCIISFSWFVSVELLHFSGFGVKFLEENLMLISFSLVSWFFIKYQVRRFVLIKHFRLFDISATLFVTFLGDGLSTQERHYS